MSEELFRSAKDLDQGKRILIAGIPVSLDPNVGPSAKPGIYGNATSSTFFRLPEVKANCAKADAEQNHVISFGAKAA